jgi:hypothetical protein
MKSFHYPPTIFISTFELENLLFITTKPIRVFLSKNNGSIEDPYYELDKNEWFFRCDSCLNNRNFIVSYENGLTEDNFCFLTSNFLYYINEPWLIKVPLSKAWTCL